MKTRHLSIIAISAIACLMVTLPAYASLVGKTHEQLFEESDVILIGNITKAVPDTSTRTTDYIIMVQKYLKNDLHQATLNITSSGCKICNFQLEDEPIFDQGDRIMLYLNKQGDTYMISPYSTVLGNSTNDNSVYSHPPGPMVPIDNGSCCDYTIPIITATLGGVALLVILIQRGKIKT